MIYIFGDSWGYSYVQTEPQVAYKDSQSFRGADLASLLMEKLDAEVVNVCERGANMFGIASKITKMGNMFAPGDVVYVLQADPLRSFFVKWYGRAMVSDIPFELTAPADIEEVSDMLLNKFYKRLKTLQDVFKITIVLHGGIVAPNRELAKSYGLVCTDKTSTEVIVPGFTDNYFVESRYIDINDKFLLEKYPLYISNIEQSLKTTDSKYAVWAANPDLFTHNHTTEAGTRIVAEYLSKVHNTL